MDVWVALATDGLWRNAIAVVPLAVLVAGVCRLARCRPATRHALWLALLVWLAIPPVLPVLQLGDQQAPRPAPSLATVPARSADAEPRVPVIEREPLEAMAAPTDAVIQPNLSPPARPSRAAGGYGRLEPRKLIVRAEPPVPDRLAPAPGSVRRTLADRDAPRRMRAAADRVARRHRPRPVLSTEPPAPAPPRLERETPAEAATGWWQRWLVGVLQVCDALGRMPPVPLLVWVGGFGVVGLIAATRMCLFHGRMRRAVPAPTVLARQIRRACRKIGLRKVPEVFLLAEQVSPLIWRPLFARRAKLILPTQLWAQLDEMGRRAVLYHELAHLRRRDHWVRWADLIVAAVYWWHPLVWWVRSRLHAEAELCCDAWVTWLLPRCRRAYAEALLTSRQFTYPPSFTLPNVGIGITTGRAGRFARRLTMVMTENRTPRASVSAMALVLGLAVAGWVATPARSCPPKKQCGHAASHTAQVATEPAPEPRNSFERHLAGRHLVATSEPRLLLVSDEDSVKERLERLEDQMARLADQLDRLSDHLEGDSGERRRTRSSSRSGRRGAVSFGVGSSDTDLRFSAPKAPKAPKAPRAPIVPDVSVAPGVYKFFEQSQTTGRMYPLAEGRLEALTELMGRSDVPILIRPHDDGIEVMGTPAQQTVFAAFVGLLDDTEEARVYRLPEGKLQALTELMIRSDVPVQVQPTDDGLEVHGTKAVHAIFEAFVWMLEPGEEGADAGGQSWRDAMEAYTKASARGQESVAAFEAQRALIEEFRAQAKGAPADARAQARKLGTEARKRAREFERQARQRARDLSKQAALLDKEAQELEERAERLSDEAETLAEEGEDV